MGYIGRGQPDRVLTSADIGEGAVTLADISFTDQPANVNITGDYPKQTMRLCDNATVTGDVTISDGLILAKLASDGDSVTLTSDGTNRTISGTGLIEANTIAQSPNQSLTGMTGTIGSGVTNNAGVASGDITTTGTFTSVGIDDNATATAMTINSSGNILIGTTLNNNGAGGQPNIINAIGSSDGGNALGIWNDGNSANYYGLMIRCGTDSGSGTNYAMGFEDGDGTDQGYVTFTSGTVSYGAFTASHDAELPEEDNENGYPYGTLVDTTDIFYKQKDGINTERGIQYKAQKTSSAYSKAVLGSYCGKHSKPKYLNLHQINILGDGHILCNGEKGNISIGDGICTSSTAGVGMKADKMAMIIGIAQENVTFSGSETKLVAVQYGLQQFTPWSD